MEYLTNTNNIRNICILAHVDHGKTTIADSLIASNGIISHRMAGKLRYLDNRPDEQERGITMKSSSIALKYRRPQGEKFLINLVDTPGHVDFCGEVSSAVRLCDGALIVVDVVEGVCPQTKAAIEQAWKEGIKPILVLNKVDRLILEQKLDETVAYLRFRELLEQVNAIVATLITTEIFEDVSTANVNQQSLKAEAGHGSLTSTTDDHHVYDWANAIEDIDDDKYYFMPEKNNVVFSSSIDGWAFTIDTFATILSEKYKINLLALQKTLWGDFYIDIKQRRILKNAQAKLKKTLFTSMILESVWKLYDAVCIRHDKIKMQKICDVLNIELNPRDLNHTDSRYQTKLIMSKWLPLSSSILEAVTRSIPSPKDLSEKRVERLLTSNMKQFNQLPERSKRLKDTFLECSSKDGSVKIACVSKMLPFEKSNLPEYRRDFSQKSIGKPSEISNNAELSDSDKNSTIFIAFARVFSGTISKGDKLFVLGPKHDPSKLNDFIGTIDSYAVMKDDLGEHVSLTTVEDCYLLMGRDLEKINQAHAGNIIGIRGIEHSLVRTATLSSDIFCPPFNDLHMSATPILRVAIEPKNPLEMSKLIMGLKILNQADPCVEVKLQQTGEHVIIATGEVHLEHCLKDLRERYTENIELNISSPIVSFRETVILPPKTDMVNETINEANINVAAEERSNNKMDAYELLTPNKQCKIKIKAAPLPDEVTKYLIDNENLKMMAKIVTSRHKCDAQSVLDSVSESSRGSVNRFKDELKSYFRESCEEKQDWKLLYDEDFVDKIWSFGPKYCGPNILAAGPELKVNFNQWTRLTNSENSDPLNESLDLIDSFVSGFQLATKAGPLCEEPMIGVCFTIIDWSYPDNNETSSHSDLVVANEKTMDSILSNEHFQKGQFGPMSGQIISTVKECCRKAFQLQPQRLMSPMFSCNIQVNSEVLGKLYAVIGRRNGRILHGDMREGSQTFEIKAFIPVIESFDFVSEIRKQTSGLANPQLIFSHYETIDVDPFWSPSTEEEYALFGEKADTENQAKKYMNLVRRRKGLPVQEKIVEHGEKQRTVKRNK